MAVYKRGRVWWYRFTWNAHPIRESTKQTNKRVAEQIEAAHKTSLAKACKIVGIEYFPPYTFRHTCLTLWSVHCEHECKPTSPAPHHLGNADVSLARPAPIGNTQDNKNRIKALNASGRFQSRCTISRLLVPVVYTGRADLIDGPTRAWQSAAATRIGVKPLGRNAYGEKWLLARIRCFGRNTPLCE